MHPNLNTCVTELLTARTSHEIWTAATKGFAAIGIDNVYYGGRNLRTGVVETPVRMSASLSAWHQSYMAEGDIERDPMFSYLARMPGIFYTGPSFTADYPFLTEADHAVIDRGADFGLLSGAALVMPQEAPDRVGGWHLLSTEGRNGFLRTFGRQRPLAERIAAFAHHAFERVGAEEVPRVRLTRREGEALSWLAAGLRTEQIAEKMGIRPVTVDLHLRNARQRLGARTREQALARAVAYGLIRP